MKARVVIAALFTLSIAACGGDTKDKAPEATTAPDPVVEAAAFRKSQQAFADSVLNASLTATQVATKLGKGYEIGSVKLRDSLGVLAAKSECLLTGRKSDPYLAGTVSFFVYMSPVGSNIVRVQESQWTSAAGTTIVDACLTEAATKWKFDITFGKPAAYISQVQFK